MVKACVWREVEVVGVGDVASLFPAWAFVWVDVDPHGGSLGAGTRVSRQTAREAVTSNCRRAVTPASCRGAACLMERLSDGRALKD